MLETVRGDIQRREAAAQELAMRASEAASRVMGEGGEIEGEGTPMEEVVPADEVTDAPDMAGMDSEEPFPMTEEMPKEEGMEPSNTQTQAEEDKEKHSGAYATESVEASTSADEITEFSADPEEPVTGAEEAPVENDAVVASAETVEEFSASDPEETPIAPETEQEEQAAVTAAAEESFEAPASHQPVLQVSQAAPVAITAGADIPGYTAGSAIADMGEVASAMEKRLHSLRRVNGGDGEQHIVASFSTAYPEARTLTTNAEENASKIDAVVGPEALVASGGHSTPFEVRYDIFSVGTNERPVRDALPKFQVDRGGIRFITPPSLVTYSSGTVYNYDSAIGVWTATNDASTTPGTKGSLTVAAASEETVSTDAVTLQLQFGNLMTRAYPELIARHNELALIQHAREAELNLISKIGTASTSVNAHVATTEAANLLGVARDFLVQVRKASAAYRSRHRLAVDTVLKAIVPAWVYDAMSADLAMNMPGNDTLAVGRSEIAGYLSSVGVDLIPSLDLNSFGAQQGSAAKLLEFPDSFVWYLFAEGTFLFLDGGTLDLGIIRDSTLVGTNDYKMFIETFENVAKVGVESLAITTNISVNGVAAALRDTTGGATAAAIEE